MGSGFDVIASLKSMAHRIDAPSVDGNHRSLIIRITKGEDESMDNDNVVQHFDRMTGSLEDLPDVIRTRPSTKTISQPLVGHSHTFIVQTYRQKEEGDTIFLQVISAEGTHRLVLPAMVADTIARQRDSLTKRSRSKAQKAKMEKAMEDGFVPFAKKQG